MWRRPSASHTLHSRQSLLLRRRTPRTHLSPFARNTPSSDGPRVLLTCELSDNLHVSVGSSTPHLADGGGGCGSTRSLSDSTNTDVVPWTPFQGLTLTYVMHPAFRTLATSHAMLFDALSEAPDLLQHMSMPNPTSGNATRTRLRCLQAAFALVHFYRSDVQRVLALPPRHRHNVDEMRLVQLIAADTPNTAFFVSRELAQAHRNTQAVLWTLLSIPCNPEIVHALLSAALRECPGGALSASSFQTCMHALLNNDNFFCERTFAPMHGLLVDEVLPALRRGAAATERGFDVLAVRWTPLMNKWARVYTKAAKGFLLRDCLDALLRAAPAAETKMPASFYVRLLGALLDAGALGGVAEAQRSWSAVCAVAVDALRLFGRNAADLRAIWVLLLKAALTLVPLREDYRRLLQAYHLCAQCGHVAPLDRQGFLQVTRLVSAAVCAAATAAEVQAVVHDFCLFLYEQDNATFLWLLDGVRTMMTDLCEVHGAEQRSADVDAAAAAAAAAAAQELLSTLEKVLRDRRVSGVDIYSIPAIARAREHFHLGDPLAFWWRCGCGEELPSSSKRCTACVRSSVVSWKCPSCATTHRQPCGAQACSCGQPNPRLAAAVKAGKAICESCGEVKEEVDGVCARCEEQRSDTQHPVVCPRCHTTYRCNALHCPSCYDANPRKPALYLWHCESCDDFNYSIWSACRTCKAPRKARAFSLPFAPWRCGCGALNHPGRLTCSSCGTGARHHTYTCAGCLAHVSIKSLRRGSVTVDEKPIPLHSCPQCQTLHPRSDLLLSSPFLPRHCMFCAADVPVACVAADGSFQHCGAMQTVRENDVFRCAHCRTNDHEMQTGYHCRHCLFPRPEVEALMAAAAEHGGNPVTAVWRCLHESDEGEMCGQWNYGWSAHCVACATGRPDSAFECRAQAQPWVCESCQHANRPIDVLFCSHCQRGLQPVQPCVTCGMPHLSYSCRVHMQH